MQNSQIFVIQVIQVSRNRHNFKSWPVIFAGSKSAHTSSKTQLDCHSSDLLRAATKTNGLKSPSSNGTEEIVRSGGYDFKPNVKKPEPYLNGFAPPASTTTKDPQYYHGHHHLSGLFEPPSGHQDPLCQLSQMSEGPKALSQHWSSVNYRHDPFDSLSAAGKLSEETVRHHQRNSPPIFSDTQHHQKFSEYSSSSYYNYHHQQSSLPLHSSTQVWSPTGFNFV